MWDDEKKKEKDKERKQLIEAGTKEEDLPPVAYDPDQKQYVWDYAAELNVYYLAKSDPKKFKAFNSAKKALMKQLDGPKDEAEIKQKFEVFEALLKELEVAHDLIGQAMAAIGDLSGGKHALRRMTPPWKMVSDGEDKYGELERWMFEGTGETTALALTKTRRWKIQAQRDTEGVLALTDREKRYLREAFQLSKKKLRGEDLNQAEIMLEEEIFKVVEFGPSHNVSAGVHQLRIKSLVKQMKHKCVFWTNTEDTLSAGSVAANTIDFNIEEVDKQAFEIASTRTPKPAVCAGGSGQKFEGGAGNEVFEFWKYGKLIGTIRKRYVKEDRQRLVDTIEQFTPTYKGMVKRKGEPGHEISDVHMQLCVNCAAFALDTTMPEMQEDQVACYIKLHLEMILGPTWHVIVGRNFGFCITAEARHFVVLRVRHLEVMIWKSEPDPNTGKKPATEEG